MICKVGGSLFHLPGLGMKLRAWLDSQAHRRILLIPGGGPPVDFIRQADQLHHLGERVSHGLALLALSLNACLLAEILPGSEATTQFDVVLEAWQEGWTPILDPRAWLAEDDKRADHLPHTWQVTSDSIAAGIALATGAEELVLLKSCHAAEPYDWEKLAGAGVVDAWFPRLASRLPKVRIVNLRGS
jgi:aspartokinase-like uncharacterized kinase